jgi:hypothetical protein
MDDLQDYIFIMRKAVDSLKTATDSSEILCVSSTQLMNEYVLIEEALRAGLLKLMKLDCSAEEQESLLELTENFSSLSAEYQDAWSEEFWESYNFIKSTVDTKSLQQTQLYVINKANAEAPEFTTQVTVEVPAEKSVEMVTVGVETSEVWPAPPPLIEARRCQTCCLS